PGWSAVDLRPDASKLAGQCLLYLPQHAPENKLELLGHDHADKHGWWFRRKLQYKLRTWSHPYKDVQALATGLLTFPSGGWNPVDPHTPYIHLGPTPIKRPLFSGGVDVTDNFNGADSDTMGVQQPWTELQGDWDIVSNVAFCSGATPGLARMDT